MSSCPDIGFRRFALDGGRAATWMLSFQTISRSFATQVSISSSVPTVIRRPSPQPGYSMYRTRIRRRFSSSYIGRTARRPCRAQTKLACESGTINPKFRKAVSNRPRDARESSRGSRSSQARSPMAAVAAAIDRASQL